MQKEADLIVYADDTAIITGSRNIELVINHQIADTNVWIKNKLVLNAKKTKTCSLMVDGIFILKNFLWVKKRLSQ